MGLARNCQNCDYVIIGRNRQRRTGDRIGDWDDEDFAKTRSVTLISVRLSRAWGRVVG